MQASRDPRPTSVAERVRASLDHQALTQADVEAVAAEISAAYANVSIPFPRAFIGKCYLGAPYDVHRLSVAGGILEHFTSGQQLPPDIAPARALALHPDYMYIEVYDDRLVCVREDGNVVIMPGGSS